MPSPHSPPMTRSCMQRKARGPIFAGRRRSLRSEVRRWSSKRSSQVMRRARWRAAQLGSDGFIALIGPRRAAVLGRPWRDMATELALDPERQIARAIATHDTWSGLTVVWPVDDSPDRLAVELSGLPVFDRDRVFRGY